MGNVALGVKGRGRPPAGGMRPLDASDAARVEELVRELKLLRLDAESALDAVMPPLRELLDVDSVATYALEQRVDGWGLARWHAAGSVAHDQTRVLLDAVIRADTATSVFYDPQRPAPEIRDRVFEATSWIETATPGAWLQSRIRRELFVPTGRADWKQVRALVCEGPILLAWFGMLHPEDATARQESILTALVPAVRARLSVERRLASSGRQTAALAGALEQLGAPGFVIAASGAIHETNAGGRALLALHRRDVGDALRDALAGRANPMQFELTSIVESGAAASWLAILRTAPSGVRIAGAVHQVAADWNLTPRQREVLALVVQGLANASIAAMLHLSARTVELHVSALLDRAGVDSRAALVVRVLAG